VHQATTGYEIFGLYNPKQVQIYNPNQEYFAFRTKLN